jgi:hypothetical protein
VPFDQSTILGDPILTPDGFELRVRWASSDPPGTTFQVYVDGVLAWSGVSRSATIARPAAFARVDVGAVRFGESGLGFGSLVPSLGGTPRRVELTWTGGTYLDDAIAGFNVYGEATPGGGIDYGTPLGHVAAYGAVVTDGWGFGGWGEGGWGVASGSYAWTSGPLYSGTWHWGVKAVDSSGNEGTAATFSETVVAAPRPPAPDAAGRMLTAAYNAGTGIVTLSWLASPPG